MSKSENSEKSVSNEKLNNRSSNIQKIQDRKKAIFNLPKASKLVNMSFFILMKFSLTTVFIQVKISTYSACQHGSCCTCTGYKIKINSDDHRKKDESSCGPENSELCNNQNCKHPFGKNMFFYSLFEKRAYVRR
jgi:hypothetical protein